MGVAGRQDRAARGTRSLRRWGIREELGLEVEAIAELDTWIYEIAPGATVRILTFGCAEKSPRSAVVSHEHSEMRWFPLADVPGLVMPEGYKQSIAAWAKMNES